MTPSTRSLSGLPGEGETLYRQAQAYLQELDECIFRLDKVLARIQPPVSGRVRVSWRKEGDGAAAHCKPVLVRWTRQGEVWRSTKLGEKNLVQRAPKIGPFYEAAETLRKTLRELSWLLGRRSALVESMRNLEKSIRFARERNAEGFEAVKVRMESLAVEAETLPCGWRDGVEALDLQNAEVLSLGDLTPEEREAFLESL